MVDYALEVQEQDVPLLSDDDLNAAIDRDEPEPEAGNEPEPEAEPKPNDADDGGTEPPEPDLKSQIEELRSKLEETEHKLTHWRSVGNRHSDEIKEVREFKERLLAEKQARSQVDPMQTLIDNPRQYHQDIINDVKREQQIVDVERHEAELQRQAQVNQNIEILKTQTPDLPQNLDGICEMLIERKEDPQLVQAFRTNPGQFSPGLVMAINEAYRQRKEREAIRKEYEDFKTKNADMFDKIEQTARQKPITNAASGSANSGSTSGLSDITEADIADLSDEDLNKLLSANQ